MSRKNKKETEAAGTPDRKRHMAAGQEHGYESETGFLGRTNAEDEMEEQAAVGARAEHDAGKAASGGEVFQDEQTERVEHPEQVELTELDALRNQLAEAQDRLLRAIAEMDNLRKRSRREVAEARRFAQADILRPLLEILDHFERAMQHAGAGAAAAEPSVSDRGAPIAGSDHSDEANPADDPEQDSFRQGVFLIAQSFRQALRDCGVRRIEAVGHPFDPALHEAVGQAPSDENNASGTVLTELQTGYIFDDLVLRASRVIVAQ